MAKLKDKVTNALNETRMLILGAQILLGFQFTAAFQPGFERLPEHSRRLDVAGLVLLMAAVAFLIAPGPFHRLSEDGRNTPRAHDFTTAMAESALVPFALCIGIDVFIVAETLFDAMASAAIGVAFSGLAALFWFGVEAAERRKEGARAMPVDHRDEQAVETSFADKIKTLMTEARVILPGAQALLGFQFTAFLSDGFEKLPDSSKLVHFASLACVALSTILLMTPAAYHRIVAQGEDRPDVDRFGSNVMLASLVPLALGLSSEFYIVANKIGYAEGPALGAAAAALIVFLGLWFAYPLMTRRMRRDAAGGRRCRKTGNDARQQL